MVSRFFRHAAPVVAIAIGTALSGCSYPVDWGGDVSGVPLGELDLSGDPPTRILLAGPDQVVISEGEEWVITLSGNAEAGEALRFDREGEDLAIARDRAVYDGRDRAVIEITLPSTSALAIAGSGQIRSATLAPEGSIEIAGSGTVAVDQIASQSLEIEIAGSGDVSATGRTDRLSVEIMGSGDVNLAGLEADDVSIEIAGSGDVEVASNGSVAAEIAGSGDITITGSATCSVQSAGSGSLTCRPASAPAPAPAPTGTRSDTGASETAAAE